MMYKKIYYIRFQQQTKSVKDSIENVSHLSRHQITAALLVLFVLMFSKDFYTANIQRVT